jgi:hypothetical protein
MLQAVRHNPLHFVTLLASSCAVAFGGLMLVFSRSVEGEGFEALTRLGVVSMLVGLAGLWTYRHLRRLSAQRKL